ncbi:MAG: enoyl-CoA hydratase-related protein [Gammaproteobacteria bacterium]|jgi:methylglutaconyl-CoA hydratase|nr:enoyl-CoA hydratase-related protein [Gammaproteobacteria bacterium]
MTAANVVCEVDQRGIATITLNRPAKHNAFDDQMIGTLIAHLQNLATNADIRALIIAGTGKSFSAGADLAWMQRMASYDHADNLADAQQLALLMHLLNTFKHPTLALVNGSAFGGAIGLMACCDSVIAVDNAKFSLSEVRIGLIPAVISPFVVNKLGHSWARHLMTNATVFDALQAQRYGLVHQVVAAEKLAETAQIWIQQTLHNSPEAVTQIKTLLRQFDSQNPLAKDYLAATEAATTEAIADIRVSKSGQAGLHAFFEKQPAPWQKDPLEP